MEWETGAIMAEVAIFASGISAIAKTGNRKSLIAYASPSPLSPARPFRSTCCRVRTGDLAVAITTILLHFDALWNKYVISFATATSRVAGDGAELAS